MILSRRFLANYLLENVDISYSEHIHIYIYVAVILFGMSVQITQKLTELDFVKNEYLEKGSSARYGYGYGITKESSAGYGYGITKGSSAGYGYGWRCHNEHVTMTS